jgi:transposase-like protein
MTVRKTQSHLLELHGFGVSHDRHSTSTDEVMVEVTHWQQ